MGLTKSELSEMLHACCNVVNEGENALLTQNHYPGIVYWEYVWTPISASGTDYGTSVTYQVSILSKEPRSKVLLKLRAMLTKRGIMPTWYHEYDQEKKIFHSYCSLDVLEEIPEE